jgi:transcriptional regulator with XRE-family HTH domain
MSLSFGHRLRQFRLERDKSMREAAREAEISVTYLSKLEADEGNPTLEVLNKLAKLYGVRVDDLTLDESSKGPSTELETSLIVFINKYADMFPELHDHDWKIMLNGIRLRGRAPKDPEDWLTIFVDLRRALGKPKP